MDLLTGNEVVKLLRLDAGRKRPQEALRFLRRTRRIGFVKVGRTVLSERAEVERFIEANRVEAIGAEGR